MNNKFSIQQLAQIVKLYYQHQSAAQARKAYQELHGIEDIKDVPSRRVILRCVNNFEASGTIVKKTKRARKPVKRTPETIQRVDDAIKANPTISLRKLEKELNVSKTTILHIIKEDLPKKAVDKANTDVKKLEKPEMS